MLSLRPYQANLVQNVITALNHGDKETLVISPTGSGKTVCVIKIAESLIESANPDEVVLILSHLSLLTEQTKKKFQRFSALPVGILQASRMPRADDRVIISTMQSARDFSKLLSYYETSKKKIRYIITDESHFRWSKSYQSIYETFPNAQLIDFTATPFRNRRLAVNGYDSVAFQTSLSELIDQKYLVPPVLRQMVIEDDTIEKKCAILMQTYVNFERGKKAIMFMRTKEECKLLCDALLFNGINAAVVTDNVRGEKRDKIFQGFDQDMYDVLLSVNVLTAGFDSLLCESVFMFGTHSPTTYLQRVGRAFRPMDGESLKPHHSKQNARIYVFGSTPTIQSGAIEKHHNRAIRPKKFSECETTEEKIEWLKDSELTDTPEYQFHVASNKVQKLAGKINISALERLIDEGSISDEFMHKLARGVDKFRNIQGGDVKASQKQVKILDSLSFKYPETITSSEASFVIQSLTGKIVGHHESDEFVLKIGRFAGSHVKDIPGAFKGIVLKRFPTSEAAKKIRAYKYHSNPHG